MKDEDQQRLFELLTEHATAFAYELRAGQLGIYFDKLKKWPMAGVERALEDCFYTCRRFPTIHDIAKAYQDRAINLNY